MSYRPVVGIIVLASALAVLVFGNQPLLARVMAREASPVAERTETLVLVEHNDTSTNVLRTAGEPAPGDIRVWGPNPLYDETNTIDTGATTQGTCIALDAAFACLLNETMIFADGSSLEFQGFDGGLAETSVQTIVGGSGRYLGATGTASVTPTDDASLWTRTIEIVLPAT